MEPLTHTATLTENMIINHLYKHGSGGIMSRDNTRIPFSVALISQSVCWDFCTDTENDEDASEANKIIVPIRAVRVERTEPQRQQSDGWMKTAEMKTMAASHCG